MKNIVVSVFRNGDESLETTVAVASPRMISIGIVMAINPNVNTNDFLNVASAKILA